MNHVLLTVDIKKKKKARLLNYCKVSDKINRLLKFNEDTPPFWRALSTYQF